MRRGRRRHEQRAESPDVTWRTSASSAIMQHKASRAKKIAAAAAASSRMPANIGATTAIGSPRMVARRTATQWGSDAKPVGSSPRTSHALVTRRPSQSSTSRASASARMRWPGMWTIGTAGA